MRLRTPCSVAPGATEMGSVAGDAPPNSAIAISFARTGNPCQRRRGRGSSWRTGRHAAAKQSTSALRPPGGRRAPGSSQIAQHKSGMQTNCKIASDRKPGRVPPPRTVQLTNTNAATLKFQEPATRRFQPAESLNRQDCHAAAVATIGQPWLTRRPSLRARGLCRDDDRCHSAANYGGTNRVRTDGACSSLSARRYRRDRVDLSRVHRHRASVRIRDLPLPTRISHHLRAGTSLCGADKLLVSVASVDQGLAL